MNKKIVMLSAVIAIGGMKILKPLPVKAYSYMDEIRHHEDYLNQQYYHNKAAKEMFKGRGKLLKRKRKGLKKAASGHKTWTGADASLFELELSMRKAGLSTARPSWGRTTIGQAKGRVR